jgi:ribosomal protein S17E
MKSWFFSLILLSFSSVVIKAILPKGEKSPLFSALRFLIATMLIAVSFSPIMPLFGTEANFEIPNPFSQTMNAEKEAQESILARFGETLNKTILNEFPNEEFTLSVYTDENKIPEAIEVTCKNKKTANEIASYITAEFQIQASAK